MSDFTIYHNPRCSKSRASLAYLQDAGIDATIILYLDTPPSPDELRIILGKLSMTPAALLRKSEADYKTHIAGKSNLTDDALIETMCRYPKLIERPIIITGNQAVIGRPPERVQELLG